MLLKVLHLLSIAAFAESEPSAPLKHQQVSMQFGKAAGGPKLTAQSISDILSSSQQEVGHKQVVVETRSATQAGHLRRLTRQCPGR